VPQELGEHGERYPPGGRSGSLSGAVLRHVHGRGVGYFADVTGSQAQIKQFLGHNAVFHLGPITMVTGYTYLVSLRLDRENFHYGGDTGC
jgi:hypothetical protein